MAAMVRPGRLIFILLVVAALAGVAAYLAWAFKASWDLGGTSELTIHGWIALALAGGLTALIGGGLMFLAFWSSRRGYDDRAGGSES
jgi:hypothetical protein